jgi:hypothetical protein
VPLTIPPALNKEAEEMDEKYNAERMFSKTENVFSEDQPLKPPSNWKAVRIMINNVFSEDQPLKPPSNWKAVRKKIAGFCFSKKPPEISLIGERRGIGRR